MNRKTVPRLAALAALTLGLATGVSALPAAAATLTIGVGADIATLDPNNYRDRSTQSVLGNVYEAPFMRIDGTNQPAIVTEWKEVDPTTYEATFKTGIKFHSGDTLTMEDIKFSFDRVLEEGALDGTTSPRKSLAGPIKSVEVVDEDTIRITLTDPWPSFPSSLSTEGGIQILNKSFVEEAGPGGLATKEDGAGPFKVASWSPGDRVVLERFDDYYGGPAQPGPVGPAQVDSAIFRVIPDTSARVAALLAGEIDIATEIPPFLQQQIQQSGNAEIVRVNGTRTFFVTLNNTKAPFDDVRVRQAANHAIDRALIIEKVLENTATIVNGILSPDSFGYSDLPAYDYDPELAKKLLAEAGYADGVDAVLDVQGPFKDLAEVIAQQLTDVGIRTTVQVWENAVITPLWNDPAKRERDMYLSSWGNAGLDPNGIFLPTLHTNDRGNYSGYSNATVDELLLAAQYETDVAKREEMYHQAEAQVNKDAPLIFLWVPQDIYGVSKRVTNFQPLPSQMIYLHRVGIASQ